MPADLEGLDALIIPGGESTVMTLGIEREGLAEPLRALASAGTPVLGTCAGMIMLDRDHLGVLDITTRRNAFGRQLRSFEADIDVSGVAGGPMHAVFIRAPVGGRLRSIGVEVLGERRRSIRWRSGRATWSRSRSIPSCPETPPARAAAGDERPRPRRLAITRRARACATRTRGSRARTRASRSAARRPARAAAARRSAPRRRGRIVRVAAAGQPRRQRARRDPGRVDEAGEQRVMGHRGQPADRVQGQRREYQPAQLAAGQRARRRPGDTR